ncbi:hypothetical protein [Tychonema sp. LEGE 07196]|uniref:hypothetical protein n=1 Tax=Tychonema sp. LEGE 07196 TaxID=1828665 RepID=UPI001880720F|nr:hypothetical protein [Tychonema sp. LEGE 07196]MBE9135600.1 hypothetical protein [Tychonema sp. LEGE 07196]
MQEIEPRSKDVARKIADIEAAHEAADQLPTDLAELEERRHELASLIEEAQGLARQISEDSEIVASSRENLLAGIDVSNEKIKTMFIEADNLLAKSEHALRGATAVGLSKAFEARKDALSRAGVAWTAGLAVALIAAAGVGWERVESLKDVLTGDKPTVVVIVNALLAILGIGAPVWFAWLSTKQIGTTFRLAEDYAFKASVAQAYEGYRTEAMQIDEDLRARLFSAALERFEEAPIRLVDPSYHSSPFQEAVSRSDLKILSEKVKEVKDNFRSLLPSKTTNFDGAIDGDEDEQAE